MVTAMTRRIRLSAAFVLTLPLLVLASPANAAQAQSDQPARDTAQPSALSELPATVELLTRRGRDGTNYIFQVPRERLDGLPQWDQVAAPEPPLSEAAARKAAEAWVKSRTPKVTTFEVSSVLVSPPGPLGPCRFKCWRYIVVLDPVVSGNR